MEIISHRGYWKSPEEKNTEQSFDRSFSMNYGTETDFRDYLENVVVSHDIADANCICAERLFEIFDTYNKSLMLALNVKADGLQKQMKSLLEKFDIKNYFFFDMSIPDTIAYMNMGLTFYSRQSEYELQPAFYESCSGIWLDAFVDIWYDKTLIVNHIDKGKKVAIVSPELHKRDPYKLWNFLKLNELYKSNEIILCTDIPEEASDFFKL